MGRIQRFQAHQGGIQSEIHVNLRSVGGTVLNRRGEMDHGSGTGHGSKGSKIKAVTKAALRSKTTPEWNESRTPGQIVRDFHNRKMEPLAMKTVTHNGNGHKMTIGFRKEGNKHLFHDATARHKSPLQPGDLPNLDKILAQSKFIRKVANHKKRKDKIKRFYYYETVLHGSKAYLHVAETDYMRNGHIAHDRFLYAVTGHLRIKNRSR